MKRAQQLPLFEPPPPVIDEASLGRNQLAVLAAIDSRGSVGVREAGRVVFRSRGHDPLRFLPEDVTAAGVTVLASLRKRGLVIQRRSDRRWTRPEIEAQRSADLIGPEALAEGPFLSTQRTVPGKRLKRLFPEHAADTSCKSALFAPDAPLLTVDLGRGAAWDVQGYEWRRTADTVAAGSPAARMRDPQRGDDGRVLR